MPKAIATMAACSALLCVGTALATPTPQQYCDSARITAWKVYKSCVGRVVAKDVRGAGGDEFAAFAKCRHKYFQKWTAFQSMPSLAGSTCIGSRFTDNGDGTVSDNLTVLVWEKKTTDGTVHTVGNAYMWTAKSGGTLEDGTVFTSFLDTLNGGGGFAGANGWRLPTLAELQSILLDFPCTGAGGGATCQCGSNPCIDATFGPTFNNSIYWSATSYLTDPSKVWAVPFNNITPIVSILKTSVIYVRAVRGGL